MPISVVLTGDAPSPIGPYNQAIAASGTFLFTAGQIPIDPKTKMVVDGDIKVQTRQTLENIRAILVKGGSSLESVVKTTVFLKNIDDFSGMNEVYAEYFKVNPPARSTVEVARLPRDVKVEIEAVALVEDGRH